MKLWMFEALDTWFFRDGTPFNMGEGGRGEVRCGFPPSSNTLQGVIRQLIAELRGWTPEKPERWPEELGSPEDLGQLHLRGPYLNFAGEWLFPAPLLLMRKKSVGERHVLMRLRPNSASTLTEIGEVRLPVLVGEHGGVAPLEGWLTGRGLARTLAGGLPDDGSIRPTSSLWEYEYRLGIGRERETRTAKDELLYTTYHVRPARGLKLGVLVGGVPDDWQPNFTKLVRFGGEGRLARVEVKDPGPILPEQPELTVRDGTIHFTATLVTPARFGSPDKLREILRHGPLGEVANCISACIGKLRQVGGWDLANKSPKPLLPALPAGSTWFYEAPASAIDHIKAIHREALGPFSPYGDGEIVLGTWKEEHEA
ncbi:hypothetical protein SY88_05660 [Clostridiales bacterium PH28_bin88]|nr:hypothetical protein SY88_05660 [Clostridiales bacterium PH28_bin88]